jgi:NAD-dependent SIR2 family protein deacetylase
MDLRIITALRAASRVVVLTGAGVSTESGIPHLSRQAACDGCREDCGPCQLEAFDQERFLRGGGLSLALTSKRSGSVQEVSAGRLVSNRTIVPCRSPLSSRKRM